LGKNYACRKSIARYSNVGKRSHDEADRGKIKTRLHEIKYWKEKGCLNHLRKRERVEVTTKGDKRDKMNTARNLGHKIRL